MGFFGRSEKQAKPDNSAAVAPQLPLVIPAVSHGSAVPAKIERNEVYAVRVRNGFKGEMHCLLAEVQLEQRRATGSTRKITGGEVIEAMLDHFKALRRGATSALSLSDEAREGIEGIARAQGITAAEAIERLVAQRAAELGLVARKR